MTRLKEHNTNRSLGGLFEGSSINIKAGINPIVKEGDWIKFVEIDYNIIPRVDIELYKSYQVITTRVNWTSTDDTRSQSKFDRLEVHVIYDDGVSKMRPLTLWRDIEHDGDHIFLSGSDDMWVLSNEPKKPNHNLNPQLKVGDEILVLDVVDQSPTKSKQLELFTKPYVVVSVMYGQPDNVTNESKMSYGVQPILDTMRQDWDSVLDSIKRGNVRQNELILHQDDKWKFNDGYDRVNETIQHTTNVLNEEEGELNGLMSRKEINDVIDRVFPQIVEDLGSVRKVPTIEVYNNIYARVTGDEHAEGEAKPHGEHYDGLIYIYQIQMTNEEQLIRTLLHEYTHSQQDPKKSKEYRELGYENNPYEIAAHEAEEDWEKYSIKLNEGMDVGLGINPKVKEGDVIMFIVDPENRLMNDFGENGVQLFIPYEVTVDHWYKTKRYTNSRGKSEVREEDVQRLVVLSKTKGYHGVYDVIEITDGFVKAGEPYKFHDTNMYSWVKTNDKQVNEGRMLPEKDPELEVGDVFVVIDEDVQVLEDVYNLSLDNYFKDANLTTLFTEYVVNEIKYWYVHDDESEYPGHPDDPPEYPNDPPEEREEMVYFVTTADGSETHPSGTPYHRFMLPKGSVYYRIDVEPILEIGDVIKVRSVGEYDEYPLLESTMKVKGLTEGEKYKVVGIREHKTGGEYYSVVNVNDYLIWETKLMIKDRSLHIEKVLWEGVDLYTKL